MACYSNVGGSKVTFEGRVRMLFQCTPKMFVSKQGSISLFYVLLLRNLDVKKEVSF